MYWQYTEVLGIISEKDDAVLTPRTTTEAISTLTDGWQDGQSIHFPQILKIFWNGPSLSNSTTSAGVSAILTPHLDSCSHFWTSFPFLKLTPLKCVLLTAQKVTWNLNLFSSAKNLSTVPCSPSNKKPSCLSWHRKFSLSWLLPTSRVVSTHPLWANFCLLFF